MQNVLWDVYLNIQPMIDLASKLENALKKNTEQVKKKVDMYERRGKGEHWNVEDGKRNHHFVSASAFMLYKKELEH